MLCLASVDSNLYVAVNICKNKKVGRLKVIDSQTDTLTDRRENKH